MTFEYWFSIIKHNKKKILLALGLLAIAIIIYLASADYLVDHSANTVVAQDLILDHIGPYNLSFIYIWLFISIIFLFFAYPLIFKPSELHFSISMFSIFVIVRSFFVIFTHLKIPIDAINPVFPGILQAFNLASNDLFFSGHVGLSFLGFLVFKKYNKYLGYFMLASSIILGITVLLMHIHYSIDVFSAFFISYGIYKIGNYFIKR